MLKLTKKGDKYWLFEDSEIGLFSPSKFTINLELNEIVIVYENGLKSKRYNVIDCEIYDLVELTPFTTSSGDLFMQKLEELNCPCFQKNENIYNIFGGGAWGSITGTLEDQTDLQGALDDLKNDVDSKQDILVSAANIKTINGTDILGSGNITIQSENDLYRSFFQVSARNDANGLVGINAPIALTTNGTQTVVGISGTSRYTSLPLQNYVSATTAGANAGLKQGTLADIVIRQGCDAYFVWANNDANANCCTSVGFYSLTAAIPNLNPSAFTTANLLLVGNDVGDTNLQFYSRRLTATAFSTKIDCGAGFPANSTTDAYVLNIYIPATEVEADRYCKMTITNIITGATFTHTFTGTEMPSDSSNGCVVINRNNRATGVATNIRVSKIHVSRLIY
jgi:hypothetical protein